MKVLVIGSGGREHALVWKLAQSNEVEKVYSAPGNAGIAQQAELVKIPAEDINSLAKFAKEKKIDLTVVGPEAPLVLGIVDLFESYGLKIFGPSRRASELEASKAFCRQLLEKYGIPSPQFKIFDEPGPAKKYLLSLKPPFVIKASGLAQGKGVIVCEDIKGAEKAIDEIMVYKKFGSAGDRLVVEEYLEGEEVSFIGITDGDTVIPMATSQDHKRVYDDDKGPNTGGMGAYSPAPAVDEALFQRIMDEIMIPTVEGMKEEGKPYKGAIYAGLMLTRDGPKVLEFNARFGDPETQPLLFRLKSDLLPFLFASIESNLKGMEMEWERDTAITVILASEGYPGNYNKGFEITGIEEANKLERTFVFHSGTAREKDKFVTSGGRVVGVTARREGIEEAISAVYDAVKLVRFKGCHYRRDIGKKALKHLKKG